MRNEHRSRSHGSLANLPFDTNNGGGDSSDQADGGGDPDQRRKAEMMQMMAEMDLEEERIVRSEVPANFYPGPPRMMYRGGSAGVDPMVAAGLYPGVHTNGGVDPMVAAGLYPGVHMNGGGVGAVNGHGQQRRRR